MRPLSAPHHCSVLGEGDEGDLSVVSGHPLATPLLCDLPPFFQPKMVDRNDIQLSLLIWDTKLDSLKRENTKFHACKNFHDIIQDVKATPLL